MEKEQLSSPVRVESAFKVLNNSLVTILYCIVLLFYVHGKHLRSCRDGQLT